MVKELQPKTDPGQFAGESLGTQIGPLAGLDSRPLLNGTARGVGVLVQECGDPKNGEDAAYLLEDRLRFETVLSELSARFINLPADRVDQEIEAGLRCIVELLGIDRSTLFQLAEDESTLVITHGWAVPGFEPVKPLIVREAVPWALRKVLSGETIVFSRIDDLPEEAARDKETMRQLGPKSNVTFPLSAGGTQVFGALAFGKMAEERTWPESLIQRLRIAAQVIANALVRKRAEQKLQLALGEIEQLQHRLQQENVYLRQEAQLLHDHEHITGRSRAIKEVLAQLEQVAATDSTVLLLGETGTGKELLATALHNLRGCD